MPSYAFAVRQIQKLAYTLLLLTHSFTCDLLPFDSFDTKHLFTIYNYRFGHVFQSYPKPYVQRFRSKSYDEKTNNKLVYNKIR